MANDQMTGQWLRFWMAARDFFLDEYTYAGTVTLLLPAHSSDQTQPFDLGIFQIEKAEASQTRPSSRLNKQTRQIAKGFNGSQKAYCPNNVKSRPRNALICSASGIVRPMDRSTAADVRY
jgi:hypothetical protein